MALRIHELPVAEFPKRLQPYIRRHNREMRDLSGLEGTLVDTRANTKRSDASIAKRNAPLVHVTRVVGLPEKPEAGSPVSQLTQEMIDILNGEGDLTFIVGVGICMSVVDDLGATRVYRLGLTWNASVTPKRPMMVLTEVT